MRIGITIGLGAEGESLWVNGIKQNAIYLAEALKHVEGVASVVLVNTTAVAITPALPWDLQRWPAVAFDAAKDALDVLIELGGQVSAQQTAYLKERGTRLVSYCCGSEYVSVMESVMFGRPMFGYELFVNPRYDAVWVIPQVAGNSLHFFRTLRRREPRIVPFVWDPVLLVQAAQALPGGGEYRPRTGARRLSVMEPNHDVVKFCLYPILIAEEAYRAAPGLVGMLHVTNAEHLATHSAEFIALMNQLSLVRDHKAAFVGRYDTPQFLSAATDVVISHQWDNPLNYAYLEACWQGYPLVHNAALCSDLGYFYPGNDVQAGCARLLEALDTHDAGHDTYRHRQRQAMSRYLPGQRALTQAYGELLHGLMQAPLT
nr:DUF2827 domain-containing protein [Ramlibacter albus]